jgi:hypothetical protein
MSHKLTKIVFFHPIPFLSVVTAISKCFVFLVPNFYTRTYCSSIMYGLYNIQDGNSCDTAGLSASVLTEQWSVVVWHGDILIRLKYSLAYSTINLWHQPNWLQCFQGAKVRNWTPIQL